jgi:antitoxin (DNA-binding transcriptional repressor) of toxin-antitoxin stability system
VLQRIDSGHTKRIEVYGATIAKLSPLSEKVKAKNVDTTQLDAEIKMLRQKMDTFTQDAAIFKQTVTDLTVMDCASDPSAFQISLEAARTAQTQVKADAEAISSYVKDTLKPTLVEIRQKLSAASGEENN